MIEQAVSMYLDRSQIVSELVVQYEQFRAGRSVAEEEWSTTQNMIFATDAAMSVGVEAASTWRNNSTRGKLAQIRDNLHANYSSAILGNKEWIKWDATARTDNVTEQRSVITAYMKNKLMLSGFDRVVDRLLLDYIDKGVAFASCRYVTKTYKRKDKSTGLVTTVTEYVGAEAVRHDPLDVVINPTASSIENSPQFIRTLVTTGELLAMKESMLQDAAFTNKIEAMIKMRQFAGTGAHDDTLKNVEYSVQGFSSFSDYLKSGIVELLEYHGNIVTKDGVLKHNQRVVIADRAIELIVEDGDLLPSRSFIKMVGWRDRPNNLYSQSPLAKLIGMQFRLDKLENIKSDAMDLSIEPPLVISGEIDDFEWKPAAVIRTDVDGQIHELGKSVTGILTAQSEIAALEQAMEEFAGAPKQAMGFRTAGEKTAFEVQSLETAGSRIFQQKVAKFERELLEPLLNDMLALSREYMTSAEEIKQIDPDLNVENFISVTRDDLVAAGYIRAVGSRHFADKARTMQELNTLANSSLLALIQPHVSVKAVADLVANLLDLDRYNIVQTYKGIEEQAEMALHSRELQQQVEMTSTTNTMPSQQDAANIMLGAQ